MNELVRIDAFTEFESQMTAFRAKYDNVVYDLNDKKQDKQARSDRYAIGQVIANLDRKHKEIKAPLKERVDLIDKERKRIKDQLLETQHSIKAQIEAHEEKLKQIAEALQKRIDQITDLTAFDDEPDSAAISGRLSTLQTIDPESPEFGDRQADAALAYRQADRSLRFMLKQRQDYEAEQAELARLRREEQERLRKLEEERIRREEAERVRKAEEEKRLREKKEAEAREQALREANEAERRRAQEAEARRKAEAEAAKQREQELIQRAKREADEAAKRAAEEERQRQERQRQAEEERAERERKEKERQAANKKHRQKIESEALADLQKYNDAVSLLAALRANKVRHVMIVY